VAIAPVELKTGAALALPPASNQQREKFRAELLIGRVEFLPRAAVICVTRDINNKNAHSARTSPIFC